MSDVITAPSAEAPASIPTFDTMTSEQSQEYLKSGKLPGISEKSDDSEQSGPESGAAPESAKEPKQETFRERRDRSAEGRIRQLNEENKKLVAQLEAAQRNRPTEQGRPSVEQKAAAATKKAIKLADFPTYEQYEEAREADFAQRLHSAVQDALKTERDGQSRAEAQTAAQQEQGKRTSAFVERANKFREGLTEDDFPDRLKEIHGSVSGKADLWLSLALVESEAGPELVHYFADHIDELNKLKAMGERAGLREFGRLEVSEKVKPATTRTRTAAKKIASDVAARGSGGDSIEEIGERKDMSAFMRIMDAREGRSRK